MEIKTTQMSSNRGYFTQSLLHSKSQPSLTFDSSSKAGTEVGQLYGETEERCR